MVRHRSRLVAVAVSPGGPARPQHILRRSSVYRVPGGDYVVLGSGPIGGIVAWYAANPWLSGARFARLFSAPDSRGIPGFLAYQAHIDPADSDDVEACHRVQREQLPS